MCSLSLFCCCCTLFFCVPFLIWLFNFPTFVDVGFPRTFFCCCVDRVINIHIWKNCHWFSYHLSHNQITLYIYKNKKKMKTSSLFWFCRCCQNSLTSWQWGSESQFSLFFKFYFLNFICKEIGDICIFLINMLAKLCLLKSFLYKQKKNHTHTQLSSTIFIFFFYSSSPFSRCYGTM